MGSLKTLALVVGSMIVLGGALAYFIDSGVPRTLEVDAAKSTQKITIIDRTGEQWDISQAVTIGFKPSGFQFGIGRDAIRPLDDDSLRDNMQSVGANTRVIGVENGDNAHAYVVRKLTRHEIANTSLGETPIAATY